MSRFFLWATAIVFVAFGLWGLADPVAMVREFGIALNGADGRTLIRASYGGFLIGAGALFAWSALSTERMRFGLASVILLTTPILLSRLIGMAVDGATSPYHKAYVAIESVGIGIAWLLLYFAKAQREEPKPVPVGSLGGAQE
jgi:Domain of unknown function (DUF4345)